MVQTIKKVEKNKKSVVREVSQGRVYIYATYNNTIITLTDSLGNVIAYSSAGKLGFKGPKKATPYAAGLVVRDAVEKSKKYNLQRVSVYVNGIGTGREAAIRALPTHGLTILSLKDITPVPHNGCRPPKVRRV